MDVRLVLKALSLFRAVISSVSEDTFFGFRNTTLDYWRMYFLFLIMTFSLVKISLEENCSGCSNSDREIHFVSINRNASKDNINALDDIINRLRDSLKSYDECERHRIFKGIWTKFESFRVLLSTGLASVPSQEYVEKNMADRALIKVNLFPEKEVVSYLLLNSTAIKNGSTIEKGIQSSMKERRKAIHIICSLPNVSPAAVEFVLENGDDDVNAKTAFNGTALMSAAETGNLEVVKLLLEKGASVKDAAVTSLGNEENHPVYLKHMNVFSGKQVVYPTEMVYTALEAAVRGGNGDLVAYLLQKGTDLASGNNSWPLLFHPVAHGRLDIVRLLLEKGVDTNTKGGFSSTALHIAAQSDETEVAALLLTKGAYVNATDGFGWTPLHVASFFANKNMIKLLLDSGSDVEAKTHTNFSVSILAVAGSNYHLLDYLQGSLNAPNRTTIEAGCAEKYKRHTEALKLLIEHGANFNPQDGVLGWSPLHWAAASGNLEAAQLLVSSYGAVVSTRSRLELTPYETAKYMGSSQVSEFLRTARDLV